MPWVLRGLREGVVTTGWPRRPDAYADGWIGGVDVLPGAADPAAERLCPTGAIGGDADGGLALDRGRCILCGACVRARPDLFAWAAGAQTARRANCAKRSASIATWFATSARQSLSDDTILAPIVCSIV